MQLSAISEKRTQHDNDARVHAVDAGSAVLPKDAVDTVDQDSTRSFLSSSVVLFGSRAFGATAGFATQVLLARAIPADDLGTFFFATSIAAVLGLVAAAGYPDVAIRFFARYRERSRSRLLGAFVQQCRREAIWASLAAIMATLAFAFFFAAESMEERWAIAIAAFAIPAFALNWLNSAYAVAVRQFALSQLPDILGRPILFLLAVGAMLLAGFEASAITLVALFSIVAIAMTVLQAAGLRRHLITPRVAPARVARVGSLWRRASAPLIVVSLFTSLFADLDLAMLGLLLPVASLAIFGICLKLAFLVGFVIQVVQQFAAPDMAEAQLRGDGRLFYRAVANANYVCFGTTVVVFAGVVICGDYVLAAFGPAYVAGYPTLVILTFAQVLRAAFGPNLNVLTTLGAGQQMAVVSTVAVAVLAVANLLLAPHWGAVGAACAVALTALFWSGSLAVVLYRLSGLRTDIMATVLRSYAPQHGTPALEAGVATPHRS